MPTNTWAMATDVSAHGSSDGNTTTEVSGSTLRTKLWSDLFGSTFDADHWLQANGLPGQGQDAPVSFIFAESGGLLRMKIDGQGATRGLTAEGKGTFAAGVAIDIIAKVNYTVNAATERNEVIFAIWTGTAENYVQIRKFTDGVSERIQFEKRVAGAVTVIGTFITADRDLSLRITRTAANVWEAFYDLAGGETWTSLGTNTQDYASTMKPVLFTLCSNQTVAGENIDANWTEFRQDAGGIFWADEIVTLTNKDIDYSLIDQSTLAVTTETGILTLDYSTDGGSTDTGTYRTTAQMQALADEPCTRLRYKVRFNGGGQFAIASIAGLAVDTVFLGAKTPQQYYTRSGI